MADNRVRSFLLAIVLVGFGILLVARPSSRASAQATNPRVATIAASRSNAGLQLSSNDLPATRSGLRVEINQATRTLDHLNSEFIQSSDPTRIGVTRTLGLRSDAVASVHSTAAGVSLKLFAIRSPGARGIRVHFEGFNIPPSHRVLVYGEHPDSHVAGPYRLRGPFGDGEFWSDTIDGDTVIIELQHDSPETPFYISEILHNYKPLVAAGLEPAVLSCHNDASCFNDLEKNSVARILFINNGSAFLCTGQLINNGSGDLAPYFLTAGHCVSHPVVARTVEAFWFYRTTACNSGVLGEWRRTPAGTSLLAYNGESDSSLLRVFAPLPSNVVFGGWDANPKPIGTLIFGLHHPGTLIPPSLDSHLRRSSGAITADTSICVTTGLTNGYRVDWASGSMEPGSSGSGLWSTASGSNLLIGVASCGSFSESCADTTLFGKFSDFYPIAQSYLDQGDSAGVCSPAGISVGQSVSGTLALTDCKSRVRGLSFNADRYSFSGVAGQQVAMILSSTTYDPYLYLLAPDKSVVTEDNNGGGGTDSRIPSGGGLITLPSTGTYVIEVTSFEPATGSYVLQLTDTAPPRILTVASLNPSSGVGIAISPADLTGQGGGVTQFSRSYMHGTLVFLTAPPTAGGAPFQMWALDGIDLTTSASFGVAMDADHTVTAIYQGPPLFQGFLDAAGCSIIAGWAWDASRPYTPIDVEVYDGSTLIGTITANLFREDIRNGGIGNGFHGFSFTTPASLRDGFAHTIRVKAAGTSVELSRSPRTLSCSNPPAVLQGYHDGAGCNTISGWAWNASDPNNPINVDIYDGTTLIATVPAIQFRPDLLSAGIGNGFHGFSLTVPQSLKNGFSHSIRVRFPGATIDLNRTPRNILCSGMLPVLEGVHEVANCSVISGWAWDRQDPNSPINVAIYDGSQLIGTVLAIQFRQDLRDSGIGNGYHAFNFNVPANLKNGQPRSIGVKFSGTALVLSSSPRTITCPP